ncbi:MAG: type II toxin-antitoxin system VapC family toxin [Candidatus Dormibacteraceae bacterium]
MSETLCLDAGIFVKALIPEEPLSQQQKAMELVERASSGVVVAPAFTWAEVGSVLRKKIRQSRVPSLDAIDAWQDFLALPVTYLDSPAIHVRAWEIAERCNLPTLYAACYLACAELESAVFWTTDEAFRREVGTEARTGVEILPR